MKKIILIGRSECGKTTLTQALKGEKIHYHKTQYVNRFDVIIDTPGEYIQTKNLGNAIAMYTFEADVVGLLMSSREPYSLYPLRYFFSLMVSRFQKLLKASFSFSSSIRTLYSRQSSQKLFTYAPVSMYEISLLFLLGYIHALVRTLGEPHFLHTHLPYECWGESPVE